MSTAVLPDALRSLDLGLAVLPVWPGTKGPTPLNGVNGATKDPEQAYKWWGEGSRFGIAVACGQVSGIIVVDYDPRKPGADASLADLDLPTTLTVNTGGGGKHYYYRYTGPAATRHGYRPGVDLQADKVFVVAPPSVHKSGKEYSWVDPEVPIAPAPDWLVRATCPDPVVPLPTREATTTPSDEGYLVVTEWADKQDPAREGSGGHDTLFSFCTQIAAEEIDGKIDHVGFDSIIDAFCARCIPPYTDQREIHHKKSEARRLTNKTPLLWPDKMPNRTDSGKVLPIRGVAVPEGTMGAVSNEEIEERRALSSRLIYKVDDRGRQTNHLLKGSHNQLTLLRYDSAWTGKIRLNEFAMQVEITDPPWIDVEAPGTEFLSNEDGKLLSQWYQRIHDFDVSANDAHEAIVIVAKSNRYNPVRDWMDSLVWDSVPRLNTWLSKYLGAEQSEYTALVGRWWLISAVARTYVPGCKADHMLQLEGMSQGEGKSTVLSTLAGAEWFSDTYFDLNNQQTSGQAIAGVLIYEFGEMSSMSRTDVGRIKGFCSSRNDKFRVPWGRVSESHPRRCVFAATTNHDQSFRDETGNRRFWPVKTGKHSLKELEQDRDQLWAEAVAAYQMGERWWPAEDSERALMGEQQDVRVIRDAWESKIEDWIKREGLDVVDIGQILKDGIGLLPGQWEERYQQRAGRTMRLMGWERFRDKKSTPERWAYRKPGWNPGD